jgi:hypothetical protein
MARLTVSYSIAFIPGLPRPLALSEVIDDVVGLSSLSSQHTVRKQPGTPDRLDIIVPVEDLPTALDSAATAADELTRIGESLLGLGFVVEERAIHIDGLADNWLPETFDGAGTRRHAPTALDAAAPLPDELDEPLGDVPDEDLRLDNLDDVPAADAELPDDPFALPPEPATADDLFADRAADRPADADVFVDGAEGRRVDPDLFADDAADRPADADLFADPSAAGHDADGDARVAPLDERDLLAAARARRANPHDGADRSDVPPRERRAAAHRSEPAVARRRDLLRQAAADPTESDRDRGGSGEARVYALFALAFIAAVAPWRLGVSTASIVGLAVAAAVLAAGSAAVWPEARSFAGRVAVTGTVTIAVVLAFASAYAICAHDGDLRGMGDSGTTVGQSLSAAVSLGASPGLSLGPGARSVAYAERLLVLLALVGAGAHVVRTAPSRGTRRDLR